MFGHDNLIKLRNQGFKPAIVFINDYPCRTNWFETGEHATVCVAGDDIAMLDMRFLAGCKVSITGNTEKRAKLLFEKAKTAGATTVGAGCAKKVTDETWTEVWHGVA